MSSSIPVQQIVKLAKSCANAMVKKCEGSDWSFKKKNGKYKEGVIDFIIKKTQILFLI